MHDETTAERPDRPTRDDEPAARVGASAAPRGRERPDRPTSALAALGWPRLLVSAWPWRAGVCLVGTVALAAAGWLVFGIPVIVVGALAAHGSLTLSGTAVCVVIELVLVVGLGPWVAPVFAGWARRPLRWADRRPVVPAAAPARGLGRYVDLGAWRQVGWLLVLAMPAGVVAAAALLVGGIAVTYAASPFVLLAQQPGSGAVALGFGSVATVAQTVPYAVAGVVLAFVVPYLWTAVAGGVGLVCRRLAEPPLPAETVEWREVARSRARLADAFEAERRRIERDLHDGAQQRLVALTIQLGLARLDVPDGSPAAAALDRAQQQARAMMTELRELIQGISPQILVDLGLPEALEELAARSPVRVSVRAELRRRPPAPVENTLYFVVCEALTNVAKHAAASPSPARATVSLWYDEPAGRLVIQVADDGPGGADPAAGTGLTGLADRLAAVGGTMVVSSPPGGPTVLRAEVPCALTEP